MLNNRMVIAKAITLLLFTSSVFMACDTGKSMKASGNIEPTGRITAVSSCKLIMSTSDKALSKMNQTCIAYSYDGISSLSITHRDLMANCCVDSFGVDIDYKNGIVSIVEHDYLTDFGCDCICPYDIDYVITGLPPGEYTILITEPYHHPAFPLLEFSVDLGSAVTWQICIDRSQ